MGTRVNQFGWLSKKGRCPYKGVAVAHWSGMDVARQVVSTHRKVFLGLIPRSAMEVLEQNFSPFGMEGGRVFSLIIWHSC